MLQTFQHNYVCIYTHIIGNATPKLLDLQRDYVPKYAARWKDLGIQLSIDVNTLDVIAVNKVNHPNFCQQCCLAMFQRWLEITPEASWDLLQKAIDDLPLITYDRISKSKYFKFLAEICMCYCT